MIETPRGVSETIPDDVPSIKQLLQRHMAGQDLDSSMVREPVYNDGDFDSVDLEEVKRMDLAEKHEFAAVLAQDVAERKAALEAAKTAIAQKLADKNPDIEDKKGKKRGEARLGGNPPDDVSSRPQHAGRKSAAQLAERSDEADTRGVSADD